MIKTSTNIDIVKYIYNELEENKKEKFKFNITTNSSMEKETEELFEIKDRLDGYLESPSDQIINTIKEYSYSKKNMKRVENFNEDHPHEKGSYNHGKRTGEWIEYYFNGEIKKRITYNNKGEEMKHIEYDKEGLIKSNTGYKN